MPRFAPKAKSKKVQPPRQSTIHQWLSLRMSLVVVATVLIGGTIAGLLIMKQVNDQINSQLQAARSSTLALYSAEQTNLLKLSLLVSMRPSLCSLLQLEDKTRLEAYLEELRVNTPADLLLVIDANGQVISSSELPFPLLEKFFQKHSTPFTDLSLWGDPLMPVLYSISEMSPSLDCSNPVSGQVVALQMLDNEFLQKLAADTGVEQSLIVADSYTGSSLPAGDWLEQPAPIGSQDTTQVRLVCKDLYACREEYFYIDHSELRNSRNEMVAILETAFPGSSLRNQMTSSILLLLGTAMVVALASVLVSRRLTQRVWSSLRVLSEAAERMGAGDLETPVPVASGWISIDQLANQLEHSRRNLQQVQKLTRRSLSRFVHLLGAIREGMVTVNQEGFVTWANQDACAILGYDNSGLIRKEVSEVFRKAPGELISIQDILYPENENNVPESLSVLNGEGEKISLSIVRSSMETGKGEAEQNIREHVLVIREISEEQAVLHLKSEFLANIAHEFRTPLATISAAMEMLIEDGQEMSVKEMRQLNQSIHMGVIHLQTLVDNLLEQATIESGVFQLRWQTIKISKIFSDVNKLMSPLLDRKQQQLVMHTEGEMQPASGDPVRLVQALVNLVQNASKFSPNGSKILLLAARTGEMIQFSVSDPGVGLPTEQFDQLFNRFFSRDPSHGSQYGIGLGLPIVKAIAEAHGGKTGAMNLEGGGAKVWFSIPAKTIHDEGEKT